MESRQSLYSHRLWLSLVNSSSHYKCSPSRQTDNNLPGNWVRGEIKEELFHSCSTENRKGHTEREASAIPLTCMCYRNGGEAWMPRSALQLLRSLRVCVVSTDQLLTYLAIDPSKWSAEEKSCASSHLTSGCISANSRKLLLTYYKDGYCWRPRQRFSPRHLPLLLCHGCTLATRGCFLCYLCVL